MTPGIGYIEGIVFGNCNCLGGCPCQFEGLPTDNICHGFEVLRIDKGHFSDVDLTGTECGDDVCLAQSHIRGQRGTPGHYRRARERSSA